MWIETVPFEDATGELRRVYDTQAAALGRPTDLTLLGSLYPELAAIRLDLYRVVEACPSTLTPAERQGVALAAVAVLGSAFLTRGVTGKFLAEGGRPEQANAIEKGDFSVLSPKAAALATYARTVAASPEEVTAADVERCRAAGATDLDILDANDLAAYYAYLARVCLGLGLRSPHEEATP